MATGLDGMLRGLMGGGRGGLGKVNLMPKVGGLSGGGGGMRGGNAAPAVRAPASGDLMTDQRSALSHGDALLKGWWEELMPTPQQRQARTNADLFSTALLGSEGQKGLLGQAITPELLAQAAGTMRQGGADAQGILDLVGYAVPAMQQQQEMDWKRQKMANEEKKLDAWLANINARTANTQAAGARAAAKAGGKGGNPDIW